MTPEEARKKLAEDPDFVNLKRFDFSLKSTLEKLPDGCTDRQIAQALMIPEDRVRSMYARIVEKIRGVLGVED